MEEEVERNKVKAAVAKDFMFPEEKKDKIVVKEEVSQGLSLNALCDTIASFHRNFCVIDEIKIMSLQTF